MRTKSGWLALAVAIAAIWVGTAAPVGVAAECGGLFQDPCAVPPDPDVGVGGKPSTDTSGGLVVPASGNRYGLRALPAPARGKPLFARSYGLLPLGLVDNSLEDNGASPEEVASIHEALGATLVRASLYW